MKCAREGQSRTDLEFLVDDVVVASMTSSRYDPREQTGFTNMDTDTPPIAIRGSLVAWQCRPLDRPGVMAKYSNVGQNCDRGTERNATGDCDRMRPGAWTCSMNDLDFATQNAQ